MGLDILESPSKLYRRWL